MLVHLLMLYSQLKDQQVAPPTSSLFLHQTYSFVVLKALVLLVPISFWLDKYKNGIKKIWIRLPAGLVQLLYLSVHLFLCMRCGLSFCPFFKTVKDWNQFERLKQSDKSDHICVQNYQLSTNFSIECYEKIIAKMIRSLLKIYWTLNLLMCCHISSKPERYFLVTKYAL